MARLRSGPIAQEPAYQARTRTSRPALKEKTNTTRSGVLVPTYKDDGDINGLVRNARTRARRGKAAEAAAHEQDQYFMAGGLGSGSEEARSQSAVRSEPAEGEATVARSQTAARANRRPLRSTRRAVQDEAHNKLLDDMKSRMRVGTRTEPAAGVIPKTGASKRTAPSSDNLPREPVSERQLARSNNDRSEFSLSPSPPPSGKLSSVKDRPRSSSILPTSVLKAKATPAAEVSQILALKNFKRRPRQPSMLQMVQQRTASARPSAAHLNANEEDLSVYDLDDVEDEEGNFTPDAQGTPLNVQKTKPGTAAAARRESRADEGPLVEPVCVNSARKRKFDDVNVSSPALNASGVERHNAIEDDLDEGFRDQAKDRAPRTKRASLEHQTTHPPQDEVELQVIHSSPHASSVLRSSPDRGLGLDMNGDAVIPSTETGQEANEHVLVDNAAKANDVLIEDDAGNETMADPASSSPLPLEPAAPQRTDIMAEPFTQVSPKTQLTSRENTKKTKPKPISTQTLQSLLPKRRERLRPRHRKSEYDIESGSENESSTAHARRPGRGDGETAGKSRRKVTAASTENQKSTNAKGKGSKAAASHRLSSKLSSLRRSTAVTSGNKTARTYGRRTTMTSDKENDDGFESLDEADDSALPDVSMSMLEAEQSKELAEAKRKFADVDEWEMAFESVDVEEGRSSSQTWR